MPTHPNFIGDESEGLLETRRRETHCFGGSKALVMHVLCWMEEYPKVSGVFEKENPLGNR
jgi:hypothetical protein